MRCKRISVHVLINERGARAAGERSLGRLICSGWLVSEASNPSDLPIRTIGLVQGMHEARGSDTRSQG